MDQEKALSIFRRTGALLDGHFRLTSGLHSPQYFQCALVLQYPEYAEALCRDIASHFSDRSIDGVISPAIGGIVAGQEVARILGCRSLFAEREQNEMTLRRGFEIKEGERILAVEDVITTGGSVREVVKLAQACGALLEGVGVIVDRSAGRARFDVELYSVMQMEVVTYQPDECPQCREGIPVIKPGSRKT